MNSLQRFQRDGLELIINTETGEAFASQSAVARMCNRNESTIRSFVSSRNLELKMTEIPTDKGFRTSRVFTESDILQALAHYNPDLLVQCAKAGIRIYLHTLAGYQVTSTATQSKTCKEDRFLPSQAVLAAREIAEIQELMFNQPRLAQILTDNCMNERIESNPTISEVEYRGVVEIAKELGYKTDHSSRVLLGSFVKSQIGSQAKKEKRLCNGILTEINCYPDTSEVRQVIKTFFEK